MRNCGLDLGPSVCLGIHSGSITREPVRNAVSAPAQSASVRTQGFVNTGLTVEEAPPWDTWETEATCPQVVVAQQLTLCEPAGP